jgi:hypothetical protein
MSIITTRSSDKTNMRCVGACVREVRLFDARDFALTHRRRNDEAQMEPSGIFLTWIGFKRSDEADKFVLRWPPGLLEQDEVALKAVAFESASAGDAGYSPRTDLI